MVDTLNISGCYKVSGHTWSHLVTPGHILLKYLMGYMADTVAIYWSYKAAGHTWSQIVKTLTGSHG